MWKRIYFNPEASIVKEEETSNVAGDDDSEEQFSQLCPCIVRLGWSTKSVIRIELPSEDHTIGATSSTLTTIEVGPNSTTTQDVTEETQAKVDAFAGASSQADASLGNEKKVEPKTQSATQTCDEDNDVQIVGETRRPGSPSVMILENAVHLLALLLDLFGIVSLS